jgi:endonuclease G, mitochondrial
MEGTEEKIRILEDYKKELFITKALYLIKMSESSKKTSIIPENFFKVIIDNKELKLKSIGFIFINLSTDNSLKSYTLSIDSVESFTGIDFFRDLPDKGDDKMEKVLIMESGKKKFITLFTLNE